MNRARQRTPTNYPAARHTAMIAEALMRRGGYPMLTEEPEHCGVSIGVTCELLWKTLAENARLRAKLGEQRANDTEKT